MKTTLGLFLLFAAALVRADDFKLIDGKEIKDVKVVRTEADGVVVMSDSGIMKIAFSQLPTDTQKRFGFDPAGDAQRIASAAAAAAESNARRREATLAKEHEELTSAATAAGVSVEQLQSAVRLKGQILQVLPEGMLIQCGSAFAGGGRVSRLGSVGGNFGGGPEPDATPSRPEQIYGKFLLVGHPAQKQKTDDDRIDVDAFPAGTFHFETVLGAPTTVKKFKVLKTVE